MNYKIKSLVTLVFFILFWNVNILNAHFPPYHYDEYNLEQGQSTLSLIKERGKLEVVILNSPTTYYAGTEKEVGFDYELIASFAKEIGVELDLHVVFTVSEALQKSRENVGDITVAGLTVTDERREEFKFGPQYHSIKEQLICSKEMKKKRKFPRDLDDLVGLKVVVGKDTSYETTLNKVKKDNPEFEFTTTTEYSTEQLLDLTHKMEIDCTVADSSVFMINQRYYPKLVSALTLGDRKSLAWILRNDEDDSLNDALYKWLNKHERSGKMAELRDQYFTFLSIFDYYDTSIFYKRLEKRLPKYKKHFVGAGKKYNIPWMLLAAQSYQESHWNPNAKSHTGVRGMMMLTNNTAKLLGVKNRVDIKQSIYGGAKYLRVIEKMIPKEITGINRWAFTLASYNVGYGHILDAQVLAKKLHKNPNSWIEIKEVLPFLSQKKYFRKLKYGYARGDEPVKYVDAIQNYYDIIQKNEIKNEFIKAEKARVAEEDRKAKAILRELNRGKVGLKVMPIRKVWVGYINLKTKRKYQKIAVDDLVIDPNEDWLLLFGGGTITLEVNHEIEKYSSSQNMRFKYVDGKLTRLKIEEFKALNDGKKW